MGCYSVHRIFCAQDKKKFYKFEHGKPWLSTWTEKKADVLIFFADFPITFTMYQTAFLS